MKLVHAVVLAALLGAAVPSMAQVLTPMEVPDPKAQRLQQRHIQALMSIGAAIEGHKFPYPFYLSRVMDLDLDKMRQAEQRSIRFDFFQTETVLEITGNYYASYSADSMDASARVKETFNQVVLPILQFSVPHFPDDSEFSSFAIEVSHHVREKLMGVREERPENVTVIFPVLAAQKLVDAKTPDQKQAAVLEARIFLNGQPFALWLQEGAPTEEWKERNTPRPKPPVAAASAAAAPPAAVSSTVSANLLKPAGTPMRILTPEALVGLQRKNQDEIDRMVKGLDKEAHFFAYAPPAFVGFRQGAYLQLSFSTPLTAPATASRYKLAALAFDEHVSHLIRPLLEYFPPDVDFDGVDFSSVIKVSDPAGKTQSVEFFLPYRMMRCFASYDCTGQQLLDSGTILIDGERSALDLQLAEGKN